MNLKSVKMSTKRRSGGAWVEVEAFELVSEVELESEVPVAVLESEVELEYMMLLLLYKKQW